MPRNSFHVAAAIAAITACVSLTACAGFGTYRQKTMSAEGRLQVAAAAASQRLKTNLSILYAATGDAGRSQQLLGDRATERELTPVIRA